MLMMYRQLRKRRRCENPELASVLLLLMRMGILLLVLRVQSRGNAGWAMGELVIHAPHAHVHVNPVLTHPWDLTSRFSMMRKGRLLVLLLLNS
jgi:hypothetical protein